MIYGLTNDAQFVPLAWAVLLGLICGVLWDILRFFRRLFPSGRIRLFAEDVLFFVVWGLLTFLLCYVTNFGIIRAYILLAQPFGFFVWYCLPGRLTLRFADWSLSAVQRLVIRPFFRVVCFCYRIVVRIKIVFAKMKEKCCKKTKKSEKNILKLQKKACKKNKTNV